MRLHSSYLINKLAFDNKRFHIFLGILFSTDILDWWHLIIFKTTIYLKLLYSFLKIKYKISSND